MPVPRDLGIRASGSRAYRCGATGQVIGRAFTGRARCPGVVGDPRYRDAWPRRTRDVVAHPAMAGVDGQGRADHASLAAFFTWASTAISGDFL